MPYRSNNPQDDELKVLKEILKWIKFAGMRELKGVLTTLLDTNQKRLIYTLSDGTNGTEAIGREAGCSSETVRKYWKTWLRIGLGENVKVRGGSRFKRSFDLEDFGIEVKRNDN